MVDKKGASYCGIKEVFSLQFMASTGVSCQMCLKNYINMVARLGDSPREEFISICTKMHAVITVAEYNKHKKCAYMK